MKNKNEYNGCNMNVRFWEPPQMLKSIEDISAELKAVNFRPAALPYNTRIMLLSMAERIHESLRSLVADLCYMSEDAEGDKQYNDAFLEAWKKSSILEVFIDANSHLKQKGAAFFVLCEKINNSSIEKTRGLVL